MIQVFYSHAHLKQANVAPCSKEYYSSADITVCVLGLSTAPQHQAKGPDFYLPRHLKRYSVGVPLGCQYR